MSDLPMRSRRVNDTVAIAPVQRSSRTCVADDLDGEPVSSHVRYSSLMGTRGPLLATPYGTLTWDANHSIGRFVRTSLGYATAEDIEYEGILIERALQRVGKIRLLVDLRAATPRNDPGFEADIVKFRRKIWGGGQQIAVLVGTAMGALQVKRHVREDCVRAEVFTQEAAALAYLAQRATSERVPRSTEAPASGPGLRRVG